MKVFRWGFGGLLLLSAVTAAAAPAETANRIREPVFQGDVLYRVAGPAGAPTVVLVHGLGDKASRDWDGLVAILARDYRVVRFDLPGFGESGKGNHAYTPDNYVALLRYLSEKQIGARPFALVGHSMGGAIAMRYAARYPQDVRALVLADVPAIVHHFVYSRHLAYFGLNTVVPGLSPGQNDQFSRLVDKVFGRTERTALPTGLIVRVPQMRERILKGDPGKIAGLALALEDFSNDIAGVQAPTLLLWGDRDEIAPLRNARILESNLPRAQLDILQGSGHVPMDDAPEIFNARVQRFLREPVITGSPHLLQESGPFPPVSLKARCEDQRGRVFEGDFDRVEIVRCTEVVVRHARIRQLQVEDSSVRIEDSRIGTVTGGLVASNSRVSITSSRIEGGTAIDANHSRLDIAGSRILARKAGITADNGTEIVFSVSRVESPYHTGFLHGRRVVTPASPL